MLTMILASLLAVGPTPSESQVLGLLKRHDLGESINSVGPIPLAGFNFWRQVPLGQGRSAVIVSTLWDSGVFFFGPGGRQLNVLKTAEVLRSWTVDLDGDGIRELVTEERVLRGTALHEAQFRLYSVTGHGRLLWRGESTAYADAWWKGYAYARRSYLRIVKDATHPYLEYRHGCGGRECVTRLRVAGGELHEE